MKESDIKGMKNALEYKDKSLAKFKKLIKDE
jgi:hypothetical protein